MLESHNIYSQTYMQLMCNPYDYCTIDLDIVERECSTVTWWRGVS